MRTIETTAVVTPEHTLTVQLPADVAPGARKVVVVIEEAVPAPKPPLPRWADWPGHDVQLTDPACTFRREDLYGDGDR